MDRLYQSPTDRLEMGRRGRALMIERYGLEHIIKEHEGIYGELLDEARRRGSCWQGADA
jgi:hypothetical protein